MPARQQRGRGGQGLQSVHGEIGWAAPLAPRRGPANGIVHSWAAAARAAHGPSGRPQVCGTLFECPAKYAPIKPIGRGAYGVVW